MMLLNKLTSEHNILTHIIDLGGSEVALSPLIRQPYTPPRVHVIQPSIQGGNITDIPESNGGLWTS